MNKEEQLNQLFSAFLLGDVSKIQRLEFQNQIVLDDVELLVNKVNTLGNPSDYCKHYNDSKTVEGFFLFIDFISALLIQLGDTALVQLDHYSYTGKFVPWLIRYVKDPRFHAEILAKFN